MKMTGWTIGMAVVGLVLGAAPARAQGAAATAQAAQAAEAVQRAEALVDAGTLVDTQQVLEQAAAAHRVLAGPMLADAELAMARAAEAVRMLPQDRDREQAERARELAERDRTRAQESQERDRDLQNRYYDAGQSALDSSRWDRAVSSFDRVIEMKGARADAALYWKAFAQSRQGQRAEALSTLAALQKDYPKSRYLEQAKALEVEVRRDAGQPVRPGHSRPSVLPSSVRSPGQRR